MIGEGDLLDVAPWVRRPPATVRVRRAAGAVLAVAAGVAVAVVLLAARPLELPTAGIAVAVGAPAGGPDPQPATSPSALLARMTATSWSLLELSLRPDGAGRAVVAARLAGPVGAPALPERLLHEVADPALDGLAPVAIIATGTGTAVELAGVVRLDASPRPGAAVTTEALPGVVADIVRTGGGEVRGIRTVASDGAGTAVAVSFIAPPEAAVRVLAGLEDGPSAPVRMSTLLARPAGELLTAEVVLTPRVPSRLGP